MYPHPVTQTAPRNVTRNEDEPVRPVSEVDREFARLQDTQERASNLLDTLLSRLTPVLADSSSGETRAKAPEEVCKSPVAMNLRTASHRTEAMVGALEYLHNSLCV